MHRAISRLAIWNISQPARLLPRPTPNNTLRPIPPWTLATWRRNVHSFQPLWQQDEQGIVDPKHQLLIGFTCKVCQERSHHVMSKLAYTKGVVLIECPGCQNRHLIADNLGWFRDSRTTVEDLIREKGEAVRKIVVDEHGIERISDLLEWLPQEELRKKEAASREAEKLRQQQEKKQD